LGFGLRVLLAMQTGDFGICCLPYLVHFYGPGCF